MGLIAQHSLHETFKTENLPPNCDFLWAPPAVIGQVARSRYEKTGLTGWAKANGVSAVLQLNGMIVPNMPAPTLSHCQDPWPYRPEAWSGWKAPLVAFVKRRRNLLAFRNAAIVGFTSHYLKDLMTSRLGMTPKRAEVFYNGLPQEMLDRASRPLPDWSSRPMEILSISNVGVYKRQELVIRALPMLVRKPGLENLLYRIAGHCEPDYAAHLRGVIANLGMEKHVLLEGRVSDARVQALFTQARAFVLMSVCESFGIPAIEAMSYGAPVVTADCCAMPEICGNAAILSPVDDLEALVNNLARILTSSEQAETLRRQGATQARRFSWDETARQMALSFEQL